MTQPVNNTASIIVCHLTSRHRFFVFERADFAATTSTGSSRFYDKRADSATPISADSINSGERVLSDATISAGSNSLG